MLSRELNLSRRSVAQGAAWAAPIVLSSSLVPVYAASQMQESGIQYGLFVTTGRYAQGVGYETSNSAPGRPATPTEHFLAPSAPENDIRWNDGSSSNSGGIFFNGEGSFTPVTQSATGADGSYASVSGFWFSVPTRNTLSGDSYIAGSTAVLTKGATFATDVEFEVPSGAEWSARNGKINGQVWSRQLSGSLNASTGNTATYLATATIPGTWTATSPVVTQQADNSYLFKARITYTTTRDYLLTQNGNKYYAQTVIMPASIYFSPAYGWNYYQQTSWVQNATISYTGGDTSDVLTLSNALQVTSRINP